MIAGFRVCCIFSEFVKNISLNYNAYFTFFIYMKHCSVSTFILIKLFFSILSKQIVIYHTVVYVFFVILHQLQLCHTSRTNNIQFYTQYLCVYQGYYKLNCKYKFYRFILLNYRIIQTSFTFIR